MKSFKKDIYSTINNDCFDCIAQDIIIGSQTWAKCNLNVDKYSDGTSIPNVSSALWGSLTTGAWCYYDNDPANEKYGKLYNWYAAVGIHDAASLSNPALRKNIAPVGYKVPSNADWNTLRTIIGGTPEDVGTKLKESGTCHWLAPNTGTNTSGFTSFPAGGRGLSNNFFNLGTRAYYWSTDEFVPSLSSGAFAIFSTITFNNTSYIYSNFNQRAGMSIRLIAE